ncbi:hypothetical protein [Salinispora arenicola]|uniref:hypothetical protein n=1 Tax=Salinispora arenicola TaxID=168697 RepID=UPI0020799B34|nr:hypothetical protein [Salinispora arenicola]MCN0151127.1 hypothetical protein [Salinispora arenicola]
MADDSRPIELHPHRDPSGRPPQPDGDRVVAEPTANKPPATTRHLWVAALILTIVVAAITIGVVR